MLIDLLLTVGAWLLALTGWALVLAARLPVPGHFAHKPAWLYFFFSAVAGEAGLWLGTLGLGLTALAQLLGASGTPAGAWAVWAMLAASLGCLLHAWAHTAAARRWLAQHGPRDGAARPLPLSMGWSVFRPNLDGLHIQRDVAYGDDPLQKLDVWHSTEAAAGPRPVFVYVHGGGWIIGSKGQQSQQLLATLARQGWLVVDANYRLSPAVSLPAHLEDVQSTLAWVQKHAAEWGGDPQQVCIGGGSAGGQLAAQAALRSLDPASPVPPVRAAVLIYGVYRLPPAVLTEQASPHERSFHRFLLAEGIMPDPTTQAQVWQDMRVTGLLQTPGQASLPMLVLHGTHDSMVPLQDSRELVEVARTTHPDVETTLWEIPGVQHGFDALSGAHGQAQAWAAAGWLQGHVARSITAQP